MTWLDYIIFALYMATIVGIGLYFFRRNKDHEDYYVEGRDLDPTHVGLSIAATDVAGGFSIGLGGLSVPTFGAFFWRRSSEPAE